MDELSVLNLADDFRAIEQAPDSCRWTLAKPEPLEVWATFCPLSAPKESFQARLLWSRYPGEPPSMKFRDPSTGRLDLPGVWPIVRGFRPTTLDTCVNWTAEGFALHPEWRTDARFRWTSDGNVLLKVLRILQDELDCHYQGRFKG